MAAAGKGSGAGAGAAPDDATGAAPDDATGAAPDGATGAAPDGAPSFEDQVDYAVRCWTQAFAVSPGFTRDNFVHHYINLPYPVQNAAQAVLQRVDASSCASPARKKRRRGSGPQPQMRQWPRLRWVGDAQEMCPRRHPYWGMRDRHHFDMVAADTEQFCGSAGTALAAGKFAFDQSQVLERGIKETVRYLYTMHGGKLNEPAKELCFRWTWHWKHVNTFTRLETALRMLRGDLLELQYHAALAKKARRECLGAVHEQSRVAAAFAAATALVVLCEKWAQFFVTLYWW
jgi:hypothetical protein